MRCRKATAGPDGSDAVVRHDADVFTLTADLTGLASTPANNAPVTGYGTDAEGRALAGPMNLYQPYRHHALDPVADAGRVRLTVHDESSPLGQDLATYVGSRRAVGAWTFQSPPVAAHNRPYYLPGPR
ncbi:hypothetical protein [Streptomyces stackebrandtii]|uniref:hypothetical protein n=1 Tax=Streptomyces stackebrandtii TaxID=3051177 RepID=UPI0028DAFD39|nr:hypothetical protein [Streptomyces sp. DSM 40976]